MEVTAGEIAAGELSRRVSPATPKTEIGRLGLALNEMLVRLELAFAERRASEDRLRQFLADASHELRTPLASIRGYAELFRMGAARDEAGTEMAMRRIEDESTRMGVLVEDLLTLARLDETPELRRQRVDIALLARDAVLDAKATAPERSIELRSPPESFVSGDPHALRQVLANLMRNALVHTPPTRGSRSGCAKTRGRSRSPFETTDPDCPTPRRRSCSGASGAPRAAASGERPVRVWGSRSCAGSSTRTTGV